MEKMTIRVVYDYEIEIDKEDPIVMDYDSEFELFENCAGYHFSEILPVIKSGGIKVIDSQVMEFEITPH